MDDANRPFAYTKCLLQRKRDKNLQRDQTKHHESKQVACRGVCVCTGEKETRHKDWTASRTQLFFEATSSSRDLRVCIRCGQNRCEASEAVFQIIRRPWESVPVA